MNPKLNKKTADKAILTFGKKIAELRKTKGITQEELAYRCKADVTNTSLNFETYKE